MSTWLRTLSILSCAHRIRTLALVGNIEGQVTTVTLASLTIDNLTYIIFDIIYGLTARGTVISRICQ
jgi:hypothetical protein